MPVSRVRRPRELPNRVAGEMPNQSLHLTAGKEIRDRVLFTWNTHRHSPLTLGSKQSEPAANAGKQLSFPHPGGRGSR